MTKKLIIVIVLVLAVIAGIVFGTRYPANAPALPSDYKDATYLVNSAPVTLTNGYAESALAPGSASKLVTQYFGNEAMGDLTGDGAADVAFLITQTGGGSGTFYYVVVALRTPDGYEGTNAILLGDRIAPQTTEIANGEVIVNYADRKPGEPFTTPPSADASKYFRVENGILVKASG